MVEDNGKTLANMVKGFNQAAQADALGDSILILNEALVKIGRSLAHENIGDLCDLSRAIQVLGAAQPATALMLLLYTDNDVRATANRAISPLTGFEPREDVLNFILRLPSNERHSLLTSIKTWANAEAAEKLSEHISDYKSKAGILVYAGAQVSAPALAELAGREVCAQARRALQLRAFYLARHMLMPLVQHSISVNRTRETAIEICFEGIDFLASHKDGDAINWAMNLKSFLGNVRDPRYAARVQKLDHIVLNTKWPDRQP